MYWLLIIVFLLSFALWKYVVGRYSYWKNQGVPQRDVMGMIKILISVFTRSKAAGDLVKDGYKMLAEERYIGTYQLLTPVVQIQSPDLIKQICVKDFDHFSDHNMILLDVDDSFWSKNLFLLKGDKWRNMRAKLSPSFTSSKMRYMFTLISETAEKFTDYFAIETKETKEVEMKDAFTRYANDVIASSAFGISCDSMNNPKNEFYMMGKSATNFNNFWTTIKFILLAIFPRLMKIFKVTLIPKKTLEFFTGLMTETIKMREEKGIVRPDMINILLEARKGKVKQEEHDKKVCDGFATVQESDLGKPPTNFELTNDDILAQALIFFFAGFDTASTAMCFMAYELTVNPDVQQKLFEEIQKTLLQNGGKLTYEALLGMKYMDMVVSETLRKWPPAIATDRLCVKPYTITPERSHEKTIHLKKGDVVLIPTIGIHYDEKYYSNPEKFDPERFSDEDKQKIDPYTFLPFGVGPRACIGSRFALLEVKTVFFHLLRKFELVVVEKTPIPMVLAKDVFNLNAQNGFWIGLKHRY